MDSASTFGLRELRGFSDLLKRRSRVIECHVQGASMGTSIKGGSKIRMRFSSEPLSEGQVVATLSHDKIVTHRIIRILGARDGQSYLLTRGDAALLPDPPVALEDVLGPVLEVNVDGRWRPVGPREERDRLPGRIVLGLATGLLTATMALNSRMGGPVHRLILMAVKPFEPEASPQAGAGSAEELVRREVEPAPSAPMNVEKDN